MLPLFFGPTERPLFGVYHEGLGGYSRHSVLMAVPIGHEYAGAYKTSRRLALSLARAGIDTLRFDFSGNGDSFGSMEEVGFEDWRNDLVHAAAELRDLSGTDALSILGIRLGATLAATVESFPSAVDTMLLWDPVISGLAYLENAGARHRALLDIPPSDAPPSELLGSPVSTSLHQDLTNLTASAFKPDPDCTVVIAESIERSETQTLLTHLQSNGVTCERHTIHDQFDWNRSNVGTALSAPAMSNFIIERLADR